MIISGLAFYLFSIIAVVAAVMVISARNPVHSVLYLIVVFFNSAALFVLMGAEFLALILVIVYVGAVAVLFLFVVMMLDIDFAELREGFLRYLPIGLVIGLILLVELFVVIGAWAFATDAANQVAAPAPPADQVDNTLALGRLLYTEYAYLFQAAGMILLVAMVGAIVLTLRHRPGTKRQRVSDQVGRRPDEVLEVRKVNPGEGI